MDPMPLDYSKSSQVQRRDAKIFLEKYSKQFRWINNGQETLLDVGCGTGDVTNDLIIPWMPEKFGKIVGVDISRKMVDYAKQHYERENVHFDILNIEGDIQQFMLNYPRGFDHVTSFYTLHWTRDLKIALRNIHDLLKPGGDCLLVFLIEHSGMYLFDQLGKDPKWSHFMSNINHHYSPFLNKKDAIDEVTMAVSQAGFSCYSIETLKKHSEKYSLILNEIYVIQTICAFDLAPQANAFNSNEWRFFQKHNEL